MNTGGFWEGFFIMLLRNEINVAFYEEGCLLIDKLFGNTLLSDRNNLKDNYFENLRIILYVIN
ncbi:hypothetical protein C6H68_05310 [Photorhabdus luminescens]|nr:hypothetical protein C6H68_05310 [Photorhabdus luminescens]